MPDHLAIIARDAMPDGGALTLEVGNRFVEQQVASTWEAQDGVGTSVSIFLPRTEEEVAEPAAEVEKNPVVPGQGVVLVVEDDPDVRATTSGMLGDLGYAQDELSHAVQEALARR